MSTAPQIQRRYTAADYVTWPDGQRWELIDGIACAMTPAPSLIHQAVCIELSAQLTQQLRGKQCRPYASPVDVYLNLPGQPKEFIQDIVQPDLVVVCDPAKRQPMGIFGPPDFIIEILSPSTAAHDQVRKTAVYEKFGVREYWVIDVVERVITIRLFEEVTKRFSAARSVTGRGKVSVSVLGGLELDFDWAFAEVP